MLLSRLIFCLIAGCITTAGVVAVFIATADKEHDRPNIVIFCDPDADGPLSRQVASKYGDSMSASPAAIAQTDSTSTWKIFYATNRSCTEVERDNRNYGSDDGELDLGVSHVELPRRRKRGRLESTLSETSDEPSVRRGRTVLTDQVNFFSELRTLLDKTQHKDVLLFIHGYNVSLDSAVCRTAQVAADLPFNGAVICFSWPSAGEATGYWHDEAHVETAVQPLAKLLADLSRELPSAKINLLAHSMGNRALLGALQQLSVRDSSSCQFHNVVLAAPDVGVDDFPKLANAAKRISERVTLYASERDKALMLSERAHGVARAGDARHLTLVDGVDAIDVSSVGLSFLGHSYYGSNRSVLSDMFELLKLNTPLSDRTWLAPSHRNGHKCWQFVGKPPEVVRTRSSQTLR